jgi:mRNA interferase RelE/StbE
VADYQIAFARSARKELEQLPKSVAERILKKVRELQNAPHPAGSKKLRGSAGLWRLRVGDYRLVYEVLESEKIIEIGRIRHRREVYRDF